MRALITGISGFVGGYLGTLLAESGYEVHGTCFGDSANVLPGAPFILHELNLTDAQAVDELIHEIAPDEVYHLAAQSSAALSWQKPALTMDINIKGTVHLLEALRIHATKAKILLIGSSEEYGFVNPENPLVDEHYPLTPGNPYAVSKLAQNQLGALYARAYHMSVAMTRSFNHIGPRQAPHFVVADFARQLVQMELGKLEPVLKVGNLQAKRDFTDVRDVVRAYVLLCRQGAAGETYNIGSGIARSIEEILQILLAHIHIAVTVQQDPDRMRPIDVPEIRCDCTKLRRLGWTPIHSLEDTMEDIIAELRKALSCEQTDASNGRLS